MPVNSFPGDNETVRLLMNASLDAVICMDEKGFISLWNKQAENIFGWKAEEAEGRKLSELVIPAGFRKNHESGLKHFLESGEGSYINRLIETEGLHRNGSFVPIELTITSIRQEKNIFFCAFIRDIKARKKTEEELIRSEKRFRSLIDQAADAIMITDATGTFLDVNAGLCKMFNYTREELLGNNIKLLIEPEQFSNDPIRFDRLLKGIPTLRERRMITREGVVIEVEANVKMITDGSMLAIARDITERKKAEAVIRISEQKYKLLFDKNPLPMWIFTKDDLRFADVNEAAVFHYGYSREEFLTMSPLDLRPPEYHALFMNQVKHGALTQTGGGGTWLHRKKNGELIHVEIIANEIIYNDKPARIVLAMDVTQKILAEERLKQSHSELRRLSSHLEDVREEERTSISREIHDELGQRLTGLKMDAAWLNKKIASADSVIHEKIAGMMSLIDDTVKTVRRISSELRPGILDDLGLTDALDWQSNEFEKRTGIRCRFKSGSKEISFEKNVSTGIFRIYQETLTNIARHSHATNIDTSLMQLNDRLVLKVKDNGVGFDAEEVKKKNTLGIMGMKERAAMLGGSLAVESEINNGTTIMLQVPLAAGENKADYFN